MANIVNCVFCGQTALNHDHDECALKYGQKIDGEMLRWAMISQNLPPLLAKKFHSPEWRGYQEYMERQKRWDRIHKHMEQTRKKVLAVVNKILSSPEARKQLAACNTPFEGRTFNVDITPKVVVSVEPQY